MRVALCTHDTWVYFAVPYRQGRLGAIGRAQEPSRENPGFVTPSYLHTCREAEPASVGQAVLADASSPAVASTRRSGPILESICQPFLVKRSLAAWRSCAIMAKR